MENKTFLCKIKFIINTKLKIIFSFLLLFLLSACSGKVQLQNDPPTPYCKDHSGMTKYNEDGSGTTALPFLICTATQLEDLSNKQTDLDKVYKLMDNIDMTGINIAPIGSSTTPFTGSIDGNKYEIKNLTINLSGTNDVGLIGNANGASISNLIITNENITGAHYVGGLFGRANDVNLENVAVSGTVTGSGSWVGGLAGDFYIGQSNPILKKIFINSNVTGDGLVGGFAGESGVSVRMTIEQIKISGTVNQTGTNGLCGGFTSRMWNSLGANQVVISNAYTDANISGKSWIGGIIGFNLGVKISNSYSSGLISCTGAQCGGIVGLEVNGVYENTFWNNSLAGQVTLGVGSNAAATGVTGVSDSQLKSQATFVGWDFVNTWKIKEAISYPELLF